MAKQELTKDSIVTIELNGLDVMIVISTITEKLESLKYQGSIESSINLSLLQIVGQKILDQIIPDDQKEAFFNFNKDMILKSLKQEKEAKEKEDKK